MAEGDSSNVPGLFRNLSRLAATGCDTGHAAVLVFVVTCIGKWSQSPLGEVSLLSG